MLLGIVAVSCPENVAAQIVPRTIDLPSSKQMASDIPGRPQRTNNLPMGMAISPDGRWAITLNGGYGTYESHYMQSLAVLNTASGAVADFPEPRTPVRAAQTLWEGVAFSRDGAHVYASLGSESSPVADGKDVSGDGILVYKFADGKLSPDRFLPLPPIALPTGHTTEIAPMGGKGNAFPAGLAVFVPKAGGPEHLLIAGNLSDSVMDLNVATGKVEHVFPVGESNVVPSAYPIDVVVSPDGRRGYVSLWNSSEVAELDLVHGTVTRRLALLKPSSDIAPGTHPCALLLDEAHHLLYVALANRDAVAVINTGNAAAPEFSVRGYFDTRLPGQSYFGGEPDALAMNADGSRIYVANMGSDSIAVLDAHKIKPMDKAKGMVEPMGFVPTEYMPMALGSNGSRLFIASAKGRGTGPNSYAQRRVKEQPSLDRAYTYGPTLLYGSLADLPLSEMDGQLKQWTGSVVVANRIRSADEPMFAGGKSPIHHVIYIIKENRTYDQILGDLQKDGKPVGNGDASLTMYGEQITPNQHKLALEFGVLDNFFDSGEVSGEGHVWSTAAITTDYMEKTWQQDYRGNKSRSYDYEGMVANGYPLLQHIPDVDEASSGYIWTDLAAHGKSLLHFAEFISSSFCGTGRETKDFDPTKGTVFGPSASCSHPSVKPGGMLPVEWGGGPNLWPWEIPLLAGNTATKPELVGHFVPESPDFNLRVPDQIRVEIFLRYLKQWTKDLAAGNDTMPNFVMLRLPNDHTEGTRPGGPTPSASVADNDLAVGRAVEAISHSAFWENTAFFIVEDDSQAGADHVDTHRSTALVISKYAPHAPEGKAAYIDSSFYSTVSMIGTMESLLGLPPMNNNDAFAPKIGSLFTGPGDHVAFEADYRNRENKLIYTANKKNAEGAQASLRMDFTREDHVPVQQLNLILWKDAKGDAPPPAMILQKYKKHDDDD